MQAARKIEIRSGLRTTGMHEAESASDLAYRAFQIISLKQCLLNHLVEQENEHGKDEGPRL